MLRTGRKPQHPPEGGKTRFDADPTIQRDIGRSIGGCSRSRARSARVLDRQVEGEKAVTADRNALSEPSVKGAPRYLTSTTYVTLVREINIENRQEWIR